MATAPLMAIWAVWAGVHGGEEKPLLYIGAVLFPLCAAVIWLTTIRRIAFHESAVHVKRYAWPTRRIEYGNIKDIGFTLIETQRGLSVPLMGIKNLGELHAMFEAAVNRGAMPESSLDGDLVVREFLANKALAYAVVPALIIGLLVRIASPRVFAVNGGGVVLGIYLAVVVVVYFMLRRKSA